MPTPRRMMTPSLMSRRPRPRRLRLKRRPPNLREEEAAEEAEAVVEKPIPPPRRSPRREVLGEDEAEATADEPESAEKSGGRLSRWLRSQSHDQKRVIHYGQNLCSSCRTETIMIERMFELLEPPASAEPAALLDGVRAASRAETQAAAQRLTGIWNLYKGATAGNRRPRGVGRGHVGCGGRRSGRRTEQSRVGRQLRADGEGDARTAAAARHGVGGRRHRLPVLSDDGLSHRSDHRPRSLAVVDGQLAEPRPRWSALSQGKLGLRGRPGCGQGRPGRGASSQGACRGPRGDHSADAGRQA